MRNPHNSISVTLSTFGLVFISESFNSESSNKKFSSASYIAISNTPIKKNYVKVKKALRI